MGRPLKIQKYGTAQGITYNSDGTANQPAAAVPVDQGYPQFSSLTDATYPATMTADNFFGVVGGYTSTSTTSTFPVVTVTVYIEGASGSHAGYILRQKGAHKYLVADTTSRTALDAEYAYLITTVGNTDWNSYGVVGTAAVGTIFTATSALANTGTGRVNLVGQCILTSDVLTAGYMTITYAENADSSATPVSKLTNKFVNDWTNFQNANGTALTSYVSSDNTGEVVYTGENAYVADFFTDEGTTAKSGADTATYGTGSSTSGTFFDSTGVVPLAQIQSTL